MTAPWESSSRICFETSQSWPLHLWHKPFPTWPLHQQSRWQIRALDVLAPSKVWPQNLGTGWLIAHSWTPFLDAMLLYSHSRLAASRRAKVSTLPWPWTMTANRRRLIWLKRIPTKIWWLQWVAAWVEWAAWAWEWVVSCLALAWEWWWTEMLAMQLWLSPPPDLRMWRIQATLEKKSSESLLGGSKSGMQRKDSVISNATLCSMKDIVARLSCTSIKGRTSSLVRMSRLRVSFVTASFKRKSWSTQGWPRDGLWASVKACRPERDTDLLDAMFLKSQEPGFAEGSKLARSRGLQFAGPEGFPVHPTKTAPAGLDPTSLESSAVTKAEKKADISKISHFFSSREDFHPALFTSCHCWFCVFVDLLYPYCIHFYRNGFTECHEPVPSLVECSQLRFGPSGGMGEYWWLFFFRKTSGPIKLHYIEFVPSGVRSTTHVWCVYIPCICNCNYAWCIIIAILCYFHIRISRHDIDMFSAVQHVLANLCPFLSICAEPSFWLEILMY